jgi:hypothetical protein
LIAFKIGVGNTLMLNVVDAPIHKFDETGVTVKIPTASTNGFILDAIKLGKVSMPELAPILGKLFVQLKVLGTVLAKFIADVEKVLHKDCEGTAEITGVGFTVIVKVLGFPTQFPLKDVGVTVKIPIFGRVLLALAAIKLDILFTPKEDIPIDALFIDQSKLLSTALLKVIGAVLLPLQTN